MLREDVMRANRSHVDVSDASAARRLKAACLALAFLCVGASAVFAGTDDDGYTDVQELNPYVLCPPVTGRMITDPWYSRSPLIHRSITLSGGAITVPMPARFTALTEWTIETWINPASATQTGILIQCLTPAGYQHFQLGLSNNIPYVSFDNIAGTIRYTAGGNPLWDAPIPANKWTHLAGVFDPANDTLELFVNGASYRAQWVPAFNAIGQCALGATTVTLGTGISGYLDEVRIWSDPRTEAEIAGGKDLFGAGVLDVVPDGADLLAYFPFDDGGFTAEDYINRLDWAYDLTPVAFTTNVFVNVSGYLDVDGDEIPDWWEDLFFAGNADPDLDTDGDGLTNIQEYELGTNPKAQDTDNNGVRDGNEDNDGDGLPNSREITLGTDPLDPDTDDDGLSDKQEVDQNLDPTDSIHPYVMRYIHNDGNGWIGVPAYVEGEDDNGSRFDLSAWTVEAVVRLQEVPTTNMVLIRRMAEPGYVTFEIGVGSNMLPYARFETALGEEYKVEGFIPIETNEWVFLGGKYGVDERDGHGQLAVFQNGTRAVRDTTDILPALGPQHGDLIIASNLVGDVDEIRIWKATIDDDEIRLRQWKSLLFGSDVAEMGSLAVNGEGLMTRLNTQDPGILTEWTIEAWVKSTTPGIVVAREAGRADDEEVIFNYNLGISPGGVPYAMFDVRDDLVLDDGSEPQYLQSGYRWGTAVLGGGTVVTDGEWHHLAFGFDGNNALLFVDGIVEGSFTLDIAGIGDLQWHLIEGETVVRYRLSTDPIVRLRNGLLVPTHTLATAFGELAIGEGINGLIDEVRIYDIPRLQQEIQDSMYTKADSAGLRSYFDFDDVELIDQIRVPDAIDKTSRGLAGVLQLGAEVVAEMGDNAPLDVSPLEVLAPKLSAYFPFDDGRWTNRADTSAMVEDVLFAGELGYAGGLYPSTANIDYALYSSTNVFEPANPYAGNEGTLVYPSSFFIPYDMPWRTDSDGDNMPDIYEQYYSLDPNRSESPDKRDLMPFSDLDGDGLKNLYEYYAGTDPTFHDSDGDGINDGDEDGDGDGLPNRDEESLGTHPGRVDSDDDGFTDLEEANALWSNAADSMDPKDYLGLGTTDRRMNFKSMVLDGGIYQIPSPNLDRRRFNAASWTIECWVRPTNAGASGSLVRYGGYVYSNNGASYITYYDIGLTNGVPYVAFQAQDFFTAMDVTLKALPLDSWTYLAAVFDDTNNFLGLYRDGTMVAQRQVFQSALSGSQAADKWPGKAYVGSPGVLGGIDDIRIWSRARTADEIGLAMYELVQLYEPGQTCNFRFDDGRRALDANTEVPDGKGPNDGQGAEDYVHRMDELDLETAWKYSLRGITFDYSNAVRTGTEEFDDGDRDGLADWWESARMNHEFLYYLPVRDMDDYVIRGIVANERIFAGTEPAFSVTYLGWSIDYTPIVSIPNRRWTEEPDGAWMLKDIYLDEDYAWVEMRVAIKDGAESLIYINGDAVNFAGVGITDADSTFNLPNGTAATTYYFSYGELAGLFVPGRNRIAVQMVNRDALAEDLGSDEYFSMELLVDGANYVIRRGDDPVIEDTDMARWWVFANPASLALPPVDFKDREWMDKDYGLDTDQDIDDDGLNNIEELLVGSNPLARDTDGDGIDDADDDADGDGLSNGEELFKYGTHPRFADTDDDGFLDGEEISSLVLCHDRWVSSPVSSRSPLVSRSLVMTGSPMVLPDRVPGESADRFDAAEWTLECWVLLTNATQTGSLIRRETGAGQTNFALRLENGTPVVEFTSATGVRYHAGGNGPLETNKWTHLAGVWDPDNDTLQLYVDAIAYQAMEVLEECAQGPGITTIGDGVQGYLDELRIWAIPRTAAEIASFYQSVDLTYAAAIASFEADEPAVGGAMTVSPGGLADTLLQAVTGTNPVPAGVTGMTSALTGDPNAIGTYMNFPPLPGSLPVSDGIVIASGDISDWPGPNDSPGTTTDFGNPGTPEMTALGGAESYDAAYLTITFTTDDTISGLSFEILFGSEEFPEWVGAFNDSFAAFLDGENISFDNNGNPITVNNNYFQLDNDQFDPYDPDAQGKNQISVALEGDGLTPLLQTQKLLSPGTHTLTFMVADVGDAILDSAAFISNLKFGEIVGPEGTVIAGLADIPGAMAAAKKKTLVAQFSFDDGGLTAEDYMHPMDKNYAVSGVLFSDDFFAGIDGVIDTDKDGIPDWWEDLFFGGEADPDDDPDGDDLNNLYEYKCDTNPHDKDTDNDSITDQLEDKDGDGLPNGQEQTQRTDPILVDTDDDGHEDGAEILAGTAPRSSLNPYTNRVLSLSGDTNSYLLLPKAARYVMESWQIEAWIRPTTVSNEAALIYYDVGNGVKSYYLGLNTNREPFILFTAADLTSNIVLVATNSQLALGSWTHVRATFDAGTHMLTIQTNDYLISTLITTKHPAANGVGPVSGGIGRGFHGLMENVKMTRFRGNTNSVMGHFVFDDGSNSNGTSGVSEWTWGQVQNFAPDITEDWKVEWRNAATLVGSGISVIGAPLGTPVDQGDQPDDDDDGGGQATAVQDSDGDGIPDEWEELWPETMLTYVFDSTEDPDEDGWDSYSEYMYAFVSGATNLNAATDPSNGLDFPTPTMDFKFKYPGLNGDGTLRIEVFNVPTMDGRPSAMVEYALADYDWTAPYKVTVANWDEGHLRQGQTWIFAYIDVDGSGSWEDPEPAGISQYQPVEVSWGDVPTVIIGLSDELPGFPRFSWTEIPGTNGYNVVIRNLSLPGAPTVLTRFVKGPRAYFHEGDYMYSLTNAMGNYSFQWFVNDESGTFNVPWPGTLTQPVALAPVGNEYLVLSKNTFKWTMDEMVSKVRIEIMAGSPTNTPVIKHTLIGPQRNWDGTYEFILPTYAGDIGLGSGIYYWRVVSINPRTSAASAPAQFTVDLSTSTDGPYNLSGTITIDGISVTGGTFIVQALDNPGFSGMPLAEQHVPADGPLTFALEGLRAATYYVWAFLDQNGNQVHDVFESFGYIADATSKYKPPLDILLGANLYGESILIHHRDTDRDTLPDAWEYQYFGDLISADQTTDSDSDGIPDVTEYMFGTNPTNPDSDGDGLSDYDEVYVYGTSPTSTDSDGDTLSDGYELSVGYDPMNDDDDSDGVPTGVEVTWDGVAGYLAGLDLNPMLTDSDWDGVTDLMEIAAGSDPLSGLSANTISISAVGIDTNGLPVVEWDIYSNIRSVDVRYTLQYSTDLINWSAIGSALTDGDSNTSTNITDTVARTNTPVVFYRLSLSID